MIASLRYLHQKEAEMQEFIWLCSSLTLSLQVKVTKLSKDGEVKEILPKEKVMLNLKYLKGAQRHLDKIKRREEEYGEEYKNEHKGEEEKFKVDLITHYICLFIS